LPCKCQTYIAVAVDKGVDHAAILGALLRDVLFDVLFPLKATFSARIKHVFEQNALGWVHCTTDSRGRRTVERTGRHRVNRYAAGHCDLAATVKLLHEFHARHPAQAHTAGVRVIQKRRLLRRQLFIMRGEVK